MQLKGRRILLRHLNGKMLKMHFISMWTDELKHLTIPLMPQSRGWCCHVVSGDVDTMALLSWDIDQGGVPGLSWALESDDTQWSRGPWCQLLVLPQPLASVLTGLVWRHQELHSHQHYQHLTPEEYVCMYILNKLFQTRETSWLLIVATTK